MTPLSDAEKNAIRDAVVRLRYSITEIADRTGWTPQYVRIALRGEIDGCDVFWNQIQRMTRNLARAT